MALFGLFGRKKETEPVQDKPHPLAIALIEGGATVEQAFDVRKSKSSSFEAFAARKGLEG